MSWLDDLSGLFGGGDGPDLSTLDPLTLPGDYMSMDNFDPNSIGSVDPWDAMGDPNAYGMDTGWVVPEGSGFTQDEWNQLQDYNNGMGGGLGDINAGGVGGGGSGGGGGSSGASALSRLFGGGSGGSTAGILSGLLPMLLAGGAGLMNRNATNQATQQTVDGINKASGQATDLINGASQNFNPYIQQGQAAIAKMGAAQPSNIAGQFGPLAGQFGNLAGNYKPLGSGRALSTLGR